MGPKDDHERDKLTLHVVKYERAEHDVENDEDVETDVRDGNADYVFRPHPLLHFK